MTLRPSAAHPYLRGWPERRHAAVEGGQNHRAVSSSWADGCTADRNLGADLRGRGGFLWNLGSRDLQFPPHRQLAAWSHLGAQLKRPSRATPSAPWREDTSTASSRWRGRRRGRVNPAADVLALAQPPTCALHVLALDAAGKVRRSHIRVPRVPRVLDPIEYPEYLGTGSHRVPIWSMACGTLFASSLRTRTRTRTPAGQATAAMCCGCQNGLRSKV